MPSMQSSWSIVLIIGVVVGLAASPVTAANVMNATSFFCGGTGPEKARVTVTEKNSVLTFRFSGRELTPNETVICGYRCSEFGTDVTGSCGTVKPNGTWSGKIELPAPSLCWGLVPVFLTGSHGACMPSAYP